MKPSENNRAQVGGIILIIFISFFLVAVALTGAVFMTLNQVGKGVVETEKSTEGNVSTPPRIETVILTCDVASGTVTEVHLTVRLSPGGGFVDYNDMILSWYSGDDYVSGIGYSEDRGYQNLSGFSIRELKGNHDAVLDVGETIEIMVHLGDHGIGGGEEFRMVLMGGEGRSAVFIGEVPSQINHKIYVL